MGIGGERRWIALTRYNDPVRSGHPVPLRFVITVDAVVAFGPRHVNGAEHGAWVRCAGDEGRDIYVTESFAELCEMMGIEQPWPGPQ